MTEEEYKAIGVQTHGLTSDLFVPIAAADLDSITRYVGTIRTHLAGRKRPTNAIVVVTARPERDARVPLWNRPDADWCYSRLHPSQQLWAHVDYAGYRRAWKRLAFGELSSDTFLDHVWNRAVVRLSGYSHPFVRLCPMSRETNTSSGLNIGQEGMQKAHLRSFEQQPPPVRKQAAARFAAPIVLADPIDLTKMLNIPPGLTELQGVAAILKQYYVATEGG